MHHGAAAYAYMLLLIFRFALFAIERLLATNVIFVNGLYGTVKIKRVCSSIESFEKKIVYFIVNKVQSLQRFLFFK